MELALTSDPQRLIDALERTPRTRDCGVVGTRYSGIWIGRDEKRAVMEERLRIVLEALRRLRGVPFPDWFEPELEDVARSWDARSGSKREAVALLRELRALRARFGASPYEERAKDWFVSSLETPDDFDALANLRGARPDLIDRKTFRESSSDLSDLIRVEMDDAISTAEDADELEREIAELRDLAAEYDIDGEALLDTFAYEDRLEELTRPDNDDDDRYDEWREERGDPDSSDDEIASLFDTLREE